LQFVANIGLVFLSECRYGYAIRGTLTGAMAAPYAPVLYLEHICVGRYPFGLLKKQGQLMGMSLNIWNIYKDFS
jgi:hypothetical protein